MLLNPTQTQQLLRTAAEHRFALLAVNADSHAAITDVLIAASTLDAPVIIETSLWQLEGHSFGAGDPLLGIDRFATTLACLANGERFRKVPVILHTDHIKGPMTLPILRRAMIETTPTYSSLSLDSSELDAARNIETICTLCAMADAAGVPLSLEMESGVDDGLTPLEEAENLLAPVESRHPGYLSLWAPGVGTQHGLGDDGYPTFNREHVAAHAAKASAITGRPIGIALHGSSGLSPESLQAAVAAGVTKVNWSSESLLIRSTAATDYYASHQTKLTKGHPAWKTTAMDNGLQTYIAERYQPKVRERIQILGGEGRGQLVRDTLAITAA